MPAKQKYSRKMCDQLYDLFKNGRSIVEVCQILEISKTCYFSWKTTHKEWAESTKRAEDAAEAWYLQRGRLAMIGARDPKTDEIIKVDTALYCFTMKTRFKYRETDDKTNPTGEQAGQPLLIKFEVAPALSEVIVTNANPDTT